MLAVEPWVITVIYDLHGNNNKILKKTFVLEPYVHVQKPDVSHVRNVFILLGLIFAVIQFTKLQLMNEKTK